MKHNFTLETTVEDSAGNEYDVTAEVDAECSGESGIPFIDEIDIYDVVLKSETEELKFDHLEAALVKLNKDQIQKIYLYVEQKVGSEIQSSIESRYEYNQE